MSAANIKPVHETALVERFCRELTALGGEVHVAGAAQVADRAAQVLAGWQTHTVAVPSDLASVDPTISQVLHSRGVKTLVWGSDIRRPKDMADAPVGLVVADYAIADTGTLVFISSSTSGKALSLLPPAILALIPESVLVATRSAVFTGLRRRNDGTETVRWPAGMAFVSGPSRTADIESDLSIGVHGPGTVAAVVVLGV